MNLKKIAIYQIFIIVLFLFTSLSANAQYYPADYDYNNYPEQDYNTNYNQEQGQSVILDDFQFDTASQLQSQWCWAACITMVLNYYDIPCTQEEVVMRTYGTTVNYPARNLYQIADYLNGWGMDSHGREVVVEAETYQYAPFEGIINELGAGRPFIIGVGNGYSGHVVVCYGVDWISTYEGPYVTNFYVYDPWPDNGHSQWNTEELNMYWVGAIAIQVSDGTYHNNNNHYNNYQNNNDNYPNYNDNNNDYYYEEYYD